MLGTTIISSGVLSLDEQSLPSKSHKERSTPCKFSLKSSRDRLCKLQRTLLRLTCGKASPDQDCIFQRKVVEVAANGSDTWPLPGLGGKFDIWEFPNIRGTLFWGLILRILLFRVLY